MGFISAMITGIANAEAQRQANDSNERIARDTNELNYKIWQENMAHNVDMFNMENQANIDMWQMQNQANVDMFNMQNDWTLNQWNRQNEYNSALAQRQRLEEAGLNPYLMMNGGNAGIGQSVNSANLQSANLNTAKMQQAQAPTMQGWNYQSPLGSAIQAGLQSLASVSQALNLNSQTKTEDQERGHKGRMNDIEYSIAKDTEESRKTIIHEEARLLTAQRIGQGLSNDAQVVINKYLDGNQQVEYYNKVYDLVLKYQQGLINEQELHNLSLQALLINEQIDTEESKQVANFASANASYAQANLAIAQAKTENETRDAKVRSANADAGLKEQELKVAKKTNNAVIAKTIAVLNAETTEAKKHQKETDWSDNPVNRTFYTIGDALRGLAGGLVSGTGVFKFGGK